MPGLGVLLVERPQQPGQVVEWDGAGGGVFGPLGRDQPAEQGTHRRAFVGEDPDVALGTAEGERLGQGIHRGRVVAAGRQRQRLQREYLDDATHPALGGRCGVQPLQQRERLGGAVLREQHPGQHQILRLPGIARLVIHAEAALFGPTVAAAMSPWASSSRARCAGTGLNRSVTRRARRDPLGLAHRVQGADRHHPRPAGSRPASPGLSPAAGCSSTADTARCPRCLPEGSVELVALVGHLRQAHVPDARGGRGRRDQARR